MGLEWAESHRRGSVFLDADQANLSGAVVAGTRLLWYHVAGLTQAQFESTASYQAKNLQGIRFGSNDLTGWDFSGQNLTGASAVSSTLTNANLSGGQSHRRVSERVDVDQCQPDGGQSHRQRI